MSADTAQNMAAVEQRSHQDPLVLWAIFSGLTFFAFFLCWYYGLAEKMVETDRTRISLFILGLYVLASLHCLWRAWRVSDEAALMSAMMRKVQGGEVPLHSKGAVGAHIDELRIKAQHQRSGTIDQSLLLRVLAGRLRGSNDFGAFMSDALMKLGLLGTIVGFIIMLAPIAGLNTENQAAVKSSMSVMSEGMAVAMYTTLLGLVCSVMVKIQYTFVETATNTIFMDAVALTEVHVIPRLERRDHGA